jgi:hypothetical protein
MVRNKTNSRVRDQAGALGTEDNGQIPVTDERLFSLASKKFPALRVTDEQFLKDVEEGRPAFSDATAEQDESAKARPWESGPVLAADLIVWLCRDSAARSKIGGAGIQIVGARIEGDIDLQWLNIPFPLVFKKCALSGNVKLGGSDIRFLDFSGSHVYSIDCTGSKIDEGIFFCDGFWANGFAKPGDDTLDADGIDVKGDVLLRKGFRAEGMVSLVGAKIGGNLECNQGVFKNIRDVALNAERLQVGGDVFLCKGSWDKGSEVNAEGFTANGEVKLGRAKIGGTLECSGGLFDNSGSRHPAINAKGLVVTGDALFHDGFIARGKVDLVEARVGGNLECNKGVFTNCNGRAALDAEGVNVAGNVFLSEESWSDSEHSDAEGFKAEGEVKLVRAVIGGDLNCIGGTFYNSAETGGAASGPKAPCSINAKGLKITGSVLLSEGCRTRGKVDLVGALVGGNLEFNSGQFINNAEEAVALDAERVKVTGDVFLCEGRWHRDEHVDDESFRITGNIGLIGAEVGGTVKFEGACFGNASADSVSSDVSLLGAIIRRGLVWKKVISPGKVRLDLRMARVGRLSLSSDNWLEQNSLHLRLDGLEYAQLVVDLPERHNGAVRSIAKSLRELWVRWRKKIASLFHRDAEEGPARIDIGPMIAWLRLQGKEFHYQPYEQLVTCLRKHGRDADAKAVLIAKAEDRARLTGMGFLERLWHWFLGVMIGYGYRPWRALVISVGVVALGSLIFEIGYGTELIKETRLVEHVVRSDTDPREKFRVDPGYPKFNAWVYSLDMFVPLVDLRQAAYWLPSAGKPKKAEETEDREKAEETDRPARAGSAQTDDEKVDLPIEVRLLRLYMWLHILAGWVLSSLLVVGLSGLVKR